MLGKRRNAFYKFTLLATIAEVRNRRPSIPYDGLFREDPAETETQPRVPVAEDKGRDALPSDNKHWETRSPGADDKTRSDSAADSGKWRRKQPFSGKNWRGRY